MLTPKDAVDQVGDMLAWRHRELLKLNKAHAYLRGRQPLPLVPAKAPKDVRRLAEISRVNLVRLVLDVLTQSLYVVDYRGADDQDSRDEWTAWQLNRWDARQIGVHRAAAGYGAAYVRVAEGDPTPVWKAFSPRWMTAVYGDDDDWPLWALEVHQGGGTRYRLWDQTHSYWVADDKGKLTFVEPTQHDFGVVPVVRFRGVEDLDDDVVGEIETLMPIQDQIDMTTFDLLVAQHFAAFRQRYAIGWTTDDENERAKATAAALWTFDEEPDALTLGEFDQTDISGHINSREASIRHMATVSQTPPQHLLGQLVNISADALVASQSGHKLKTTALKTSCGESHEAVMELTAIAMGLEHDPMAQVRWDDTESRSLSATADALGKLAAQLGVPARGLWERIPGVTKQDLDRWEKLLQEDPVAQLGRLLERQGG